MLTPGRSDLYVCAWYLDQGVLLARSAGSGGLAGLDSAVRVVGFPERAKDNYGCNRLRILEIDSSELRVIAPR